MQNTPTLTSSQRYVSIFKETNDNIFLFFFLIEMKIHEPAELLRRKQTVL